MQKIPPPSKTIDYAIGDLDQDRGVLWHHQMRVTRGAVTKVIPALDVSRHRIAQSSEFGEDVGFVGGGAVWEVLLENQDFLANIPLDRQILVRDRIDNLS